MAALGTPTGILWFVFLGFLGGFTFILIESTEKWGDLVSFYAFKRYVIGGIVGLLYHIGYSEYSFPNKLMGFVSGYAGVTFIQGLVHRYESFRKGDIENG